MSSSIVHNYIHLTRLDSFPLGSAIVFWPSAFGVTMASYCFGLSASDLSRQLIGFGAGCTLLHSTFCILNDICDRDIDGLVERTKSRPLVTGAVSLHGAWILFLAFISATACMLATFGLLSLPLHVLYPLTKRWTWWAQAWLGVCGGWSLFVGWFSVAGTRTTREHVLALFSMYAAVICWDIYVDTIYASQDRKDDARIGIFSVARLFESRLRAFSAFCAFCAVALLICAGLFLGYGIPYYAIACGGASCHFAWQLYSWDPNDNKSSGMMFKVRKMHSLDGLPD
ncbi:UbiA prenyltransferase [Peniophora sp. CONT]|nr:UbiA prenyltransferase [Peniophora sp. CONT]